MSNPLVSIIIPNLNGCEVLQKCLKSLYAADYKDFEVILVDNASTDNTVAETTKNFPQVKIIKLPKNIGFTGGCNVGVQAAQTKYIALFNNDMEVEPDWLTHTITLLESNPNAAAVQAKLKSIYKKDRFDYSCASGGMLDIFGYAFAIGRIFDTVEDDHGQYDKSIPIFWAGAMIAQRDVYLAAGGLDDSYFAHYEEIDLCWRMHLMGYELFSMPKSVIYHYNAYTIPPKSSWKMYLNQRNSLITIIKNLPWLRLLWVYPLRLIFDLATVFLAGIKGDWARPWATIKANIYVLFHLIPIFKARNKSRCLRQVNDKTVLDRLYKGSIVIDYFAKGKKTAKQIIQL